MLGKDTNNSFKKWLLQHIICSKNITFLSLERYILSLFPMPAASLKLSRWVMRSCCGEEPASDVSRVVSPRVAVRYSFFFGGMV